MNLSYLFNESKQFITLNRVNSVSFVYVKQRKQERDEKI